MIITSKDNQKIKYLKKIRDDSKERFLNSLFFVEGERNIENIDITLIQEVYICEGYKGYVPNINEDKIYKIKKDIFEDIKDTKTTQGIVSLVKMPTYQKDMDINKFIAKMDGDKLLILDNIQDAGNLGTIFRTAEASGIKNILLVNNCVDAYSPKVVRASMSSITRLNLYKTLNMDADIDCFKNNGYKIIGTFIDGEKVYTENIYSGKTALVIGNEANGISSNMKSKCDIKINIPMCGKIESLNASIATAIILYEVKRQNELI